MSRVTFITNIQSSAQIFSYGILTLLVMHLEVCLACKNPVSAVHKGFTSNTCVRPGPTYVGNRKQAS